MITPPADVRIVLVAEPVDFRKGGPGLARLVEQYLQEHRKRHETPTWRSAAVCA